MFSGSCCAELHRSAAPPCLCLRKDRIGSPFNLLSICRQGDGWRHSHYQTHTHTPSATHNQLVPTAQWTLSVTAQEHYRTRSLQAPWESRRQAVLQQSACCWQRWLKVLIGSYCSQLPSITGSVRLLLSAYTTLVEYTVCLLLTSTPLTNVRLFEICGFGFSF